MQTVKLRDVDRLRREGLQEEWIRAHRNDRGIVPINAIIYFRIDPYP